MAPNDNSITTSSLDMMPIPSHSPSRSVQVGSVEAPNQLVIVSCYSDFERLAHGPRGSEAKECLYVYRFNPHDGSMLLLNIAGDAKDVMNPAFTRRHPRLNVVYTCTEDVSENGKIIAYEFDKEGDMKIIGQVDAGGTSTCYLTIDRDEKNLLVVNYWDSTLVTIPLSVETGEFMGPITSMYDPKMGKGLMASAKKDGGSNHSNNDESTIKMRQADPHSHALVLEPYVGTIAYVPCLGKDVIREFFYDKREGKIVKEMNALPSGLCTGCPDGPRYVEFHPKHNTMYVVNELSSTVAVFAVNKELIYEINRAAENNESLDRFKEMSTLTLLQSIKTTPSAFPVKLNTCGRICIHSSGRFVLVSNRGHQSIAILRVIDKGPEIGYLSTVGYFHTRGETPRHFKFDRSGQFLIVANQDSNNLSVFKFNQSSGEIQPTGNDYIIPSPNFVCCCEVQDTYDVKKGYMVGESDYETMEESSGSESSVDATSSCEKQKELLAAKLAKAMNEVKLLETQLASIAA